MSKSGRLRVATFNICSGRDPATGAVDPEKLRGAVQELDADLLALQEVDRHQPRSGDRDQAADAADAMGCEPQNWRFAAALRGTPGERWEPIEAGDLTVDGAAGGASRPAYGIALLSKLPVREWNEIRLAAPPAPVRPNARNGGTHGKARLVLLEDEPRVALVAVVDTGSRSLTVVCTHLSFIPGWNLRQLRQLHHQLRTCPRPLVLAGDLNVPGRVPAMITGWQPRVRARTFPSPNPRSQLDHILSDGLDSGSGGRAVRLDISDHRALVVELPT